MAGCNLFVDTMGDPTLLLCFTVVPLFLLGGRTGMSLNCFDGWIPGPAAGSSVVRITVDCRAFGVCWC